MTAKIIWLLITVTYGGEVHESQHLNEASCADARSIALTGQTVAEQAHETAMRQWRNLLNPVDLFSSDSVGTFSYSDDSYDNKNEIKYAKCVQAKDQG